MACVSDIRRLSGCLLFLGQLTPASPSATLSHPYASFFSPSGNARLWHTAYTRAKSLALVQLQRAPHDPLVTTLRACDIALPQIVRFHAVRKSNAELIQGDGDMAAQPVRNSTIRSVCLVSVAACTLAHSLVLSRFLHFFPFQELDLGSAFQFHSTFICPVTKEQCNNEPAADDVINLDAIAPSAAQMGGLSMSHMQAQAAAAAHAAAAAQLPHSNPPVMLKCGHVISLLAMDKIVKTLRLTRSDRARETASAAFSSLFLLRSFLVISLLVPCLAVASNVRRVLVSSCRRRFSSSTSNTQLLTMHVN